MHPLMSEGSKNKYFQLAFLLYQLLYKVLLSFSLSILLLTIKRI